MASPSGAHDDAAAQACLEGLRIRHKIPPRMDRGRERRSGARPVSGNEVGGAGAEDRHRFARPVQVGSRRTVAVPCVRDVRREIGLHAVAARASGTEPHEW